MEEDACFSLKQMAVNGHDLMTLGLSGPALGKTLNLLLDQIVNGELPNEKELLMERAKECMEME